MPYLIALLVLSGAAASRAPWSEPGDIANPEALARAEPLDPFHASVINAALALLGAPYHYAGFGPGGCPTAEHDVCSDCSGLVGFAYESAGITLPRSSAGLVTVGEPVARADVLPGDILVFRSDGSANGRANHCGLYIGNGLFVHACSRGVRLDDLDGAYWGETRVPRLRAIRRVSAPP